MNRIKKQRLAYTLAGLLNAALQAQTLSFPGPDAVTLKGEWYPASHLPAPAIVLLHGCGGAYNKAGDINARHAGMAAYLNEHGYSALLVDSFTPRGIHEICTQKFAERSVHPAERAKDALAALDWLARRSDVEAAHIGLLGWSHGGSTTLKTLLESRLKTAPHFAAAVAFYPGCKESAKQRYVPSAPLLILIGEADDWTPFAPCRAVFEQSRPDGPSLEMHSYPATYHDFDNPALKSARKRSEVPNGVNPGQGVTVAPNPEAAKDAWQRSADWFARWFAAKG